MSDDSSKGGAEEPGGTEAGVKASAGRPGICGTLTTWTVLGLVVTAACAGVLVWVEGSVAIPEMDRLLVAAGVLIVYVIIMASGARVAYKCCQRG